MPVHRATFSLTGIANNGAGDLVVTADLVPSATTAPVTIEGLFGGAIPATPAEGTIFRVVAQNINADGSTAETAQDTPVLYADESNQEVVVSTFQATIASPGALLELRSLDKAGFGATDYKTFLFAAPNGTGTDLTLYALGYIEGNYQYKAPLAVKVEGAVMKLGFFEQAPVAQPELPATPTVQDIATALVALGLVTQSS